MVNGIGDLVDHLPQNQGFDEYYCGIPYSNDMFIGSTHKFADTVRFLNDYTLDPSKKMIRNLLKKTIMIEKK